MNLREKIIHRIEEARDLPTLPRVATEVLALAGRSETSVRQIGRLVEKDPVLAARVLGVVNSAFYALPQRVTSVNLALAMLGMKRLRNLVAGIAVLRSFPAEPGKPHFDRERFWEHCVGCGMTARLVASKLGLSFDEEEFVGGLTHDLGKLMLDHYFHAEFLEVLDLAAREHIPTHVAEQRLLGINHAEVGAWLAEKWNLPPSLMAVIRYHHEPAAAPGAPPLVALIHFADLLCKAKGIGFDGDICGVALQDDEAWAALRRIRPVAEDLDLERLTFELDDEIERSREFIQLSVRPADRADLEG